MKFQAGQFVGPCFDAKHFIWSAFDQKATLCSGPQTFWCYPRKVTGSFLKGLSFTLIKFYLIARLTGRLAVLIKTSSNLHTFF